MKNLLKKLALRFAQLILIVVGKSCEKIAEFCAKTFNATIPKETSFDLKNATVLEIEKYYDISRRQAYKKYQNLHPKKTDKEEIKIFVGGKELSPVEETVRNIFLTRKISERK